jgi:sialate O-acetylesterase
MKILNGLFSRMVLQRAKGSVSDAAFDGECNCAGVVKTRVSKSGIKLKKLDGAACGKADGAAFKGVLRGIPTGGPHTVDLWIEDRQGKALARRKISDVLVGDVWICAGQSNMQGIGLLKDAARPHPLVRAFYMHDEWGVAKDPIHNRWQAVDPVHQLLNNNVRCAKPLYTGVGPAVAFGVELHRRSGVPQGLLACAHGGTSMTQWYPSKKADGTTLYGATLRRVRKNGGKVAGIIWYQGESDANPQAAPLYTQRMKALVAAFRKDLRQPALPFIAVQIGRHIANTSQFTSWNLIQEQQRHLHKIIPNLTMTPTIDLTMDDSIHISGADQQRLGRRLAESADVLRRGVSKNALPPIELKNISLAFNKVSGCADIILEFSNVRGKLVAESQPTGFMLNNCGDIASHYIYRTTLDKNRVILHTLLSMQDAQAKQLFHGWGYNPCCNIRDEGDRSLPVIAGQLLNTVMACTPFINKLDVSPLLPSAGKLDGLKYPDIATLGLQARAFPAAFCDLHLELGPRAPEDVLIYLRKVIDCPEAMRLKLLAGYDGPVKIWIDGAERFHDPEGANPARPDDASISLNSPGGKHEILVALSSNHGKAWGIYLHIERLDVTKKQIAQGRGAYLMPVLE